MRKSDNTAINDGNNNYDPRYSKKTAFQTSSPWIPQIDVRSNMAIVYGTNDRENLTFEQRIQSWRDKGYQTAL